MALNEPQTMITLCVLSYTDETPLPGESVAQQEARMLADINNALGTPLPGWRVAWGPGLTADRANMMYVAGNRATNQYAVVIRGTDWSFVLDWLEDFTSVLQIPAPYNSKVEISFGTAVGIIAINSMTAADGTTVTQFLKTLPSSAQLYVTGHSLGGGLASAYAPWLVTDGFGAKTMKVYTFAAPTAGDQDFATYYNNLFPSRAFRYYNQIDLVPNAWATLPNIEQLFNPWPTCPSTVADLIDWAVPHIPAYVQTGSAPAGSAIVLPGKIHWTSTLAEDDPINDLAWVYQVAMQHASTYYAQLLGANASVHNLKIANTISAPPKMTVAPPLPLSRS